MSADVRRLHNRAMVYADEARRVKMKGMERLAQAYYGTAYHSEIVAANATPVEPSRGILYRSAAALACEAGLFHEALEAVDAGLAGAVADDIAMELREVRGRALLWMGSV